MQKHILVQIRLRRATGEGCHLKKKSNEPTNSTSRVVWKTVKYIYLFKKGNILSTISIIFIRRSLLAGVGERSEQGAGAPLVYIYIYYIQNKFMNLLFY